MKKIFIRVDTSTVGTKGYYFVDVPDDITNDQLDTLVQEFALENADMYGIYPPSMFGNEDEEDCGEVDEDIGGSWELYNAEKHNMYTNTGTPDFINLT